MTAPHKKRKYSVDDLGVNSERVSSDYKNLLNIWHLFVAHSQYTKILHGWILSMKNYNSNNNNKNNNFI